MEKIEAREVRFRKRVAGDFTGDPPDVDIALHDLAAKLTANPGGGASSRVWIIDLAGVGTISDKVWETNTSPANKVLQEGKSDDDNVTVKVLIEGGAGQDWHADASVTVDGGGSTPVVVPKQNWTQVGSSRMWEATANLTDADTTLDIEASLPTGDTATLIYSRTNNPPAINTLIFANQGAQNPGDIYPDGTFAGQSAFKNNDTIKISGTCDTWATGITIKDFESTNGEGTQTLSASGGTFSGNITAGNVTATGQRLRAYATWAGADGADTTSTATCELDQASPTIPTPTFDYTVGAKPSSGVSGNEGLRFGGTCTATASIAAGDRDGSITYSSPTGNVTPTSSTTYQLDKTWTHNGAAGDWWDSVDGNNCRIVAHKNKNDTATTKNFVLDLEIDMDFAVVDADLYQGAQVAVGSGDTYKITGTHEAAITKVRFTRNGDYSGTGTSLAKSTDDDQSVAGSTFALSSTARTDNVRDGAFNSKTCEIDVEVFKSGAWRTRHKIVDNHNAFGSIEVDTQTVPTFSSATISNYPAGQSALKGAETADVAITHTNPDIYSPNYLYSDNGTGDFTPSGIPATTTYAVTKTVTRKAGGYRVTGTNYKLEVTQDDYNGMVASKTALVKIANTAAVITLTNNGEASPKVFRSKTGAAKTYTITATSNQDMNEITIKRDAGGVLPDDGAALSAWAGGPKVWTSTITIAEADTKNLAGVAYDFEETGGTNWGKNIANQATTVSPADTTYRVAGFESRNIQMNQFLEHKAIGTQVSNRDNANKYKCDWLDDGQVFQQALTYIGGDTQNDGGREFSASDSGGTFDATGVEVLCLDGEIFNPFSSGYYLRVEELA